jgi:hypothetical protein
MKRALIPRGQFIVQDKGISFALEEIGNLLQN